MTIDYRNTCDECQINMNEDGMEIFCVDCVDKLKAKIDELEKEVERLNNME